MSSNEDFGWHSFPLKKGDVEKDPLAEEMTMQDEKFEEIEDLLNSMGAGMTKEMVRVSVGQLADVIKNVKLDDSSTLPEEQYGRKLYKNVLSMFSHEWGSVLRSIVKNNYPLGRFIEKRSVEISNFTSKLQDADMYEPIPPNKEYLESLAKGKMWEYERAKAEERSQMSPSARTREVKAAEELADEQMLSDFEAERHRTYAVQYSDYMQKLTAYQTQQTEKKILKGKLERTAILSAVVEGLRGAVSSITSKVKNSASLHDRVKMKLCARVVLEDTGETIENPYDNNNLSGMMQLLKALYFTATLVHFNADFQRALGASISKEDAAKNPMRAVSVVEKNITTWATMNYWDFMTPDIFWTNLLLRTIPACDFQSKCVEHVVWFITERESGDGKDDKSTKSGRTSKSSMPVYDNLRDYIQRHEESNRHKPSVVHNQVPTSPNPNSQYTAGRGKGNVEHAHAVAQAELFTTFVGRDKEIKCKDVNTGMEFPYTATAEVCASCFSRNAQCHKPKCYTGACKKCLLYGHKGDQCKQDVSSTKKN